MKQLLPSRFTFKTPQISPCFVNSGQGEGTAGQGPHLHSPRTLFPINQLLQWVLRVVGRQARGHLTFII